MQDVTRSCSEFETCARLNEAACLLMQFYREETARLGRRALRELSSVSAEQGFVGPQADWGRISLCSRFLSLCGAFLVLCVGFGVVTYRNCWARPGKISVVNTRLFLSMVMPTNP